MKTKIFVLFILFLSINNIFPQSDKEKQIKGVETGLLPFNVFEGEPGYSLDERMKYYNVPGISVTVIKDFQVLWTKHYGVSDEKANTPVTDETLFNVGSLSKGLASLSILSMIQQGKLSLDEDVNLKLKSWKVPQNEFTQKATVTPRLLMNHSGGAMHSYSINYTRENFPTITQLLRGEAPAQEMPTVIDRIPGTEFLYSNPGFAILQQFSEDINGKPFYITVRENVFEKLGMYKSTFQQPLPPESESVASTAYRKSTSPLPVKCYFYPNAAAGGLWTTTIDFAKYVIELQKSYHGKSNKIISRDLAKEMLKTHVSPEYGLGLFIRKINDEIYFGHMGDVAGFFAGFVSHLTDGYAVIVFSNSSTAPELIREITRSAAKYYNWKGFLPEIFKATEVSEETKKQITGRYKSGSDGVIEIKSENGDLIISNLENEKLFHLGDNTFKIKRRDGEIKFVKGDDGTIREAEYVFADEIGRISKTKNRAIKMQAWEKTPNELINEGQINEAADLYRKIYKDNPKDEAVSENRLNSLGYDYIAREKYEQALAILRLNTEFYPQSANCYDSYGEALYLSGKVEDAIKSYEKAIELNPNSSNAIEMIKKIKEK